VTQIRRRTRRSPLILAIAAVLLLLIFFPAIVALHADVLWFREVGFMRVFTTEIAARVSLFFVVALLAFAILYGNARFAQRGRVFNPFILQGQQGPPLDVTEMVRRMTLPAALAISIFMGLAATSWWMTVLQALHAASFGAADPVFGRDVGYYVFTLPLVATVLGRERAAVGPRAAAPDVRPAPGDPHLLRLRLGRRRPLLDRRPLPAGAALAARAELRSLPTRTFINEHLTFTHGMGLTLAPVNQVTPRGCRCCSSRTCRRLERRPRGHAAADLLRRADRRNHVFVNTLQPEFDYPAGDENVFTAYEGRAACRCRRARRAARMLASRFGSLTVLLSGDITADSRVLYHRNIMRPRPQGAAVPALRQDPYMVITGEDGELKWILDAYTSTTRYPYSRGCRRHQLHAQQREGGDRRLRRHGHAYIADPTTRSSARTRASSRASCARWRQMPDLRAHLRYPEDLYRCRWAVHHLPHGRPGGVLPPRGPVADPHARSARATAGAVHAPHHHAAAGEEQEEFIFMTPFTPRQKDNLAAWMVARNDGEHYGELIEYRFPRRAWCSGRGRWSTASTRTPRSRGRSRSGTSAARR
jgi:uncharacterized membrane protein (UPF0182 family)